MGVETRALTLSERSAQPAGVGCYAGPPLGRQHLALRSDRRADLAKDKVDSLCVVDVEKFVHQCELPRRRAHWVLEDELATLCGLFQTQEH